MKAYAQPSPALLFLSQHQLLAHDVASFAHNHQLPLIYAADFEEGRIVASQTPLRCILLDVMREDGSGFLFAEWVRQQPMLDAVDLIFVSDTHPAAHFRASALPRYRAMAYFDLPVPRDVLFQILLLQLQRNTHSFLPTSSNSNASSHLQRTTPAPSSSRTPASVLPRTHSERSDSSAHTGASPASWAAHFSSEYPEPPQATSPPPPSPSSYAVASWPDASASWSGEGAADLNPTQFLTDPNDWAQSIFSRPSLRQEMPHNALEHVPLEHDDLADTGNYGQAPDYEELSAESTAEEIPCIPRDLHAPLASAASQEFVPPTLAPSSSSLRAPSSSSLRAPSSSSLRAPSSSVPSQPHDTTRRFEDEQTHAPHKSAAHLPAATLEGGNSEAEAAFTEGLQWLAQRDFGHALPLFARAFQSQNAPRYECYFAWTLFLSQPQNQLQAKIALMHLDKSRKADPHHEKTYLFMGHIFQQMRRFDEALQIYREALAFSPTFLEVYRELRLLELQVTRAFKS